MSTSGTQQPDSATGTQQNQVEPNPPVPSTPTEVNIIEGEVAKLLKDFEELQQNFEEEKDKIENSIKVPIVEKAQPEEPAQQSQSQVPAVVLTNESSITLSNGTENYKIEAFDYTSSEAVIEAIKYEEENFSKFSNADGELGIKFETKLNEKMVKIDMKEINKEEKKDEYILEQINAAFKSGTESAAAAEQRGTAWVGGKKRKNKTKGNKSPIKKKHRTKRK